MPDVVVVGAGPVGLLLAGELSRRGVDVVVLERRPAAGAGSRAIGVHAPVLAALEASGVTERLLSGAVRVHRGEARAQGRVLGVVRFDRLSTRFPFVATLPQAATESALAARAPAPRRGVTVTGVRPRGDAVQVSGTGTADAGDAAIEIAAQIAVVAGGAGSRALVYRSPALAAREYADRYVMADAAVEASVEHDVAVVHLDRDGVLESFPLPGGARRFVAWDSPAADRSPTAQRDRLRAALAARGIATAEPVAEVTGFGVRRVVAGRLRNGRVIVIGDAAHEVSPIGGQGMNLGLLDAVTLAPILAEWVRSGTPPESELRRWERRRVASARTAARLAALNTALGRPLAAGADRVRRLAVHAMLGPATGGIFARAYAMGFDRDA